MDTTIARIIEKIDEIEKDMAGKELGEEIERLRLKAGWNQDELAQRIGLHQSRVSKLEKGEHNYPLETIYRLANAFQISPFELAAVYWGLKPELPNRDREFLNSLLKLFDDYRTITPPHERNTPVREHSEKTKSEIVRAKAENKKLTAARRATLQPVEPETISSQETEP